jgi:hypothetical protein
MLAGRTLLLLVMSKIPYRRSTSFSVSLDFSFLQAILTLRVLRGTLKMYFQQEERRIKNGASGSVL